MEGQNETPGTGESGMSTIITIGIFVVLLTSVGIGGYFLYKRQNSAVVATTDKDTSTKEDTVKSQATTTQATTTIKPKSTTPDPTDTAQATAIKGIVNAINSIGGTKLV